MIFGAAFSDKRAGALAAEIRVDDSVKRFGEFQIHFHGARGATQTRRGPVGSNRVRQVVQFGDDPVQGGLLRQSVALVLDVQASLGVVGLSPGHDGQQAGQH